MICFVSFRKNKYDVINFMYLVKWEIKYCKLRAISSVVVDLQHCKKCVKYSASQFVWTISFMGMATGKTRMRDDYCNVPATHCSFALI